jgi:hypothetical protein
MRFEISPLHLEQQGGRRQTQAVLVMAARRVGIDVAAKEILNSA